jgi:hypothetical protein
VVIDHGVLVETRRTGTTPRLSTGHPDPVSVTVVAPSVEAAEEASIIWRWLESNQVRLVECSGTFAHPLHRAERLTPARLAA